MSGVWAADPAPPRVIVDTAYQPPSGRRIVVRAGGQLQIALNMAQPGDTIALEAGAVFRGNFILPKKSGSRWIIIRSAAADGLLPSEGTRVGPELAPAMPKLITPNSSPVILTAPGAHHYRFIGIEFGVATNVSRLRSIVAFGGRQEKDTDTPHHLILDRCYVHGHALLDGFRGVLLNSAWSAIIDSYISDMHVRGFDSQAILGYNGPGPFKIVNNYLEGAGENIMFGGADPVIRNLVPSDIEIVRNHLAKPRSWAPADSSVCGNGLDDEDSSRAEECTKSADRGESARERVRRGRGCSSTHTAQSAEYGALVGGTGCRLSQQHSQECVGRIEDTGHR